jgi:predicted TIM-barrel fold metal-dependent hydrolase
MTPPTYDVPFSLLEIRESDLTSDQKNDVLVGNFERLFGLAESQSKGMV